ncbi:hypothetical protein ACFX5U_09895 [Sphingobacterium sp. SG20118]|uniref:hypothetical protein n=1 Tax=unclassified Sphingobacterium TaxID=2609468 RepID=UPI0004F7C725|nr:hypothetical protein [Sphingobacterium sp. ML3W]AIM37135.1 hypothetical protein KO02_10875 [Sphingobacterium sp. ML3W]
MKNTKLKDEFEKVNESSGTSPHRYSTEAYQKPKKAKCNKNLLWIGGAIGLYLMWHCCQSGKSKNSLFSFLGCSADSCNSESCKA